MRKVQCAWNDGLLIPETSIQNSSPFGTSSGTRVSGDAFVLPDGDSFAQDFPNCLDTCITVSEVRYVLSHTRSNTSVGSDGWNLADMKVLEDGFLQMLVDAWNGIFSAVLCVPSTWMLSRVLLLAKVLEPDRITDCRPITIAPLCYRVCARALNRKLTRQLLPYLPVGVLGGLPGRAAWESYYCTQTLIENAHLTQGRLMGASMDIVKFFNCLPRPAVLQILKAAGIPEACAKVWLDLLNSLHRHLRVQNFLSTGHTSRVGVPEGDPLSVLTAALFGSYWLHRLKRIPGNGTDGKVVATIFVDNLDFLSDCPEMFGLAIRETLKMQDEFSLAIDVKKSWTWYVNVPVNRRFQGDFVRRLSSKNLGAALTYVKQPRNSVQVSRMEAATGKMKRLINLPVELGEKVRLMKAGVLQAAFACAEVTFLGGKHFARFRDVMCGVFYTTHHWAHRKAALFLLDQSVDPFLWVTFMQIKMLRRALWSSEAAWTFAQEVLSGDIDSPGNPFGPITALKSHLSVLNIVLDGEGFMISPLWPKVHIRGDDWLLVQECILEAWGQHIAVELGGRKGVTRDLSIDWCATRNLITQMPSVRDQAAVRTHLSGSIATEERYSHVSGCSVLCPACGETDTVAHRVLRCSHTHLLRDECPSLRELDETAALFPYVPRLPAQDLFVRACRARPKLEWLPQDGDELIVAFTDGAGQDPTSSVCDTSWAVVITRPSTWDSRTCAAEARISKCAPPIFDVFATGKTSGRQTVGRAELSAAIVAIGSFKNLRLVTDSAYVLSTIEAWKKNPVLSYWANRPNFDLILELRDALMAHAGPRTLQFDKIKSHQDELLDVTRLADLELIDFWGNDRADHAAGRALEADNPEVLSNRNRAQRKHKWSSVLLGIASTVKVFPVPKASDEGDHGGGNFPADPARTDSPPSGFTALCMPIPGFPIAGLASLVVTDANRKSLASALEVLALMLLWRRKVLHCLRSVRLRQMKLPNSLKPATCHRRLRVEGATVLVLPARRPLLPRLRPPVQ